MDEKKGILRTIFLSTLGFFLTLAVALLLSAAAAKSLPTRIEKALARGDTARASTLTARIKDEELRAAFETRCRLAEADACMKAGKWREAAALYASLGDASGAAEGYAGARYRLAEQERENGAWDEAAALFDALGAYADAPEQAQRARYEKADALERAGEVHESILLFHKLGDYADARERTMKLAVTICGKRDLDAALAAARYLSPTEVAHRNELKEKRDALPKGIVAVGFYHTAALKSDGTVVACGDNSFGECDVGAWRHVRAICAGAYHTVGLLEDGTVIAAGRNDEGQCDVGDWRDIVAVTAADWATFGLKRDGTVVACGFNGYPTLADWTRVTDISGGSYGLAALRADGDALLSHESARSDELRDLCGIAVNTGYAVGLREDGSAVCAAADLSGWTDIVAVSASANAILGLDAQGRVRAVFFHPDAELDLSSLRGV
ncbi:MAG TPA: hypothetical protein DCM61_03050, partial [Clostridiales bacterium]|nr:hypothetical protein [Clostridiales bacterium]